MGNAQTVPSKSARFGSKWASKWLWVGLASLGVAVILAVNTLHAASNITINSPLSFDQQLMPGQYAPVFSVKFGSPVTNETLTSIKVKVSTVAGASQATIDAGQATNSVLEDLQAWGGGLSLWKASNSAATTFDQFLDLQQVLNAATYASDGTVTLTLSNTSTINANDVYYVVARIDDMGVLNNAGNSFTLPANAITTSEGVQTTNSLVANGKLWVNASEPGIVSVKYLNTAAPLAEGSQMQLKFDQSMDATSISSTNLSYNFYCYNPSNYNSGAFGSNPSATWSKTELNNDTLTLTFGANPNITQGMKCSPSAKSLSGTYSYDPFYIDTLAPALTSVTVMKGQNGQFKVKGDMMYLLFSKAIDETTLNGSNASSVLALSGGNVWAANPFLSWVTPNMAIITLRENQSANLADGVITIDPANTVKSQSGFADNTLILPKISMPQLDKPGFSQLLAGDEDIATSYGISNNDISVTHQMNATTDAATHYAHFWVLPLDGKTTFDPVLTYHVNSSGVTTNSTAAQKWVGTSSTYSLYYDSRTNYANQYNTEWNTLKENFPYIVFGATSTAQNPAGLADYGLLTASNTFYFSSESAVDYTKPDVLGVSPANGSKDLGTNLKALTVQFSEAMDATKMTTSNVKLAYDSNSDGTYETETASEVLYFSGYNMVTVRPNADLVASKKYQLSISTNVTDSAGNGLSSTYYTVFTTGTSSSTSASKVSTSTIANNATNISATTSELRLVFDKPMDWSSLDSNKISFNPLVGGTVSYDINNNAFIYKFSEALMGNSSYTVTLGSSGGINNAHGVAFDGDANGTGGGTYTLNFQTGVLDTGAPSITSVDFDDANAEVVFDKEMNTNDVITAGNWTLTCDNSSTGYSSSYSTSTYSSYGYTGSSTSYSVDTQSSSSTVSLSSATFSYDAKKLKISDLYLVTNASCTITAGSNVRSSAGTAILSTANSKTSTVHSNYSASYSATYTTDSYASTYNQPSVWAKNQQTGATTTYSLYIPMNGVSMPSGSKLKITWPSSFNISSATPDASSYYYSDLNGWNDGTITVASSAVDTTTKVQTLTLNGTVGSNDYLNIDIANVVNGDAAEIDYTTYDYTTGKYSGGYQLTISAEQSNGSSLFSGVKTYQFAVTSVGTGSISGKVKDQNGNGISGVVIKTWSGSSEVSATTDSSGNYTLTGLTNNDWYYLYGEYQGSWLYSNKSYSISASSQVVTGADFTVQAKSETISVTFTHSASLAGKKVSLYCWNESSYENLSTTVTLASATSTKASLASTTGTYSCSAYEAFDWSSSNGTYSYTSSFTAPSSQSVKVSTGVTANVTFALSAADKTISGYVYDQNGSGLANVSVSVYSRDYSTSGSSAWTSTSSDGSFKVNVAASVETTYVVSVYQSGMGSYEKEVIVKTNGTTDPSSLTFKLSKTSSTITGTVLDDSNNALSYVSIMAYASDSGQTQWASTDSNGKYTVYVAADTWSISANSWDRGQIPCTSGSATSCSVTVAANATGTANFKYDTSKIKKISGTVTVDGAAVQYASIWAELYDTTTGKQVGYTPAWASTDSTGAYSLTVTANTSTQRYRVMAWTYNNGQLGSKDNINVSSSDATGVNLTSSATSVTLNVTNAPTGVTSVSVSAADKNDAKDVGKWNSMTIASGSASASFSLQKDTTYKIVMNVPGYSDDVTATSATGGTLNSDGSIAFTGTSATVTFNLSALSSTSITVTGTVKAGSTGVSKAIVQLFDPATGSGTNTYTDSTGAYSISAKSGVTYKLVASRSGYIGSETKVSASGTKNLTMTLADSVISGTLQQNGATVDSGSVWVEGTDGTWAQSTVNSDATWSVAVPASKTFTVYGITKSGYKGSKTSVTSGTTGVVINATTQLVTSFATPASTGTTPSGGGILDDRTGSNSTGMYIAQPGGAYKNSNQSDTSGGGTMGTKEVVVPDAKVGFDAVGSTAIEVTQTDSSGNPITNFSSPVTMNLVVSKSDVTNAINNGDLTLNQLDKVQLGYFDSGTQSWLPLAGGSTQTCETQSKSSSSFTEIKCASLVDNLKTGTNYNDYRITLKSSTTHFTIFGTITAADSTAPSAPSGLTATAASSTSVTLSWTANTDSDLLNYNVYRSTTSGFTPSSTTQINTSEVTSAAYTDSGLTAGTTYYYKVTAVDTSGNESSASSQASVTPGSSSSSSSSSSATSGGGASSSDDDSDDSSEDEEDSGAATEDSQEEASEEDTGDVTAEATPEETGLDYTGHWAEDYIQVLVDRGVVSGYADAPEGYEVYYAPDNNLTRAELAKIVVNLFEYVAAAVDEMPFVDVDVDEWYAPFVAKLKDLGVVEGYADGTYGPNQAITRAEAMKILLGGAGKDAENYIWESNPFNDIDTDEWYAPYVLYAYDHGYVSGYKDADGNLTGEFGPGNEVTRGEMSKMAVEVAGLGE